VTILDCDTILVFVETLYVFWFRTLVFTVQHKDKMLQI